MASSKLITYRDTLLFPVLLKAIQEATDSIELMTFVFKTSYGTPNRAQEIADALNAAAARGVDVYVVLNYSQYEPDVYVTNYQTAQSLAAGGCRVRLGVKNTTLHTKLTIIDGLRVFAGSHNITRGALSFNREFTIASRSVSLVGRAHDYFLEVWESSIRFAQAPPPTVGGGPVAIELTAEAIVGEAVNLTFSVNHTEGVDAFAAVAAAQLSLAGARMGDTVSPSQRTASVIPEAAAGDTIYVAVRAYREGQVIATSEKVKLIYQPEGTPPGGNGDGGGGGEPPPPEPLTAPTLTSVVRATGNDVTATWEFVGHANSARFEIQRRDLALLWVPLGIVMDETAREWTGEAANSTEDTPFRVVVFTRTPESEATESAASNSMSLAPLPALQAPVLTTLYRVGAMGLHVDWTVTTQQNFARFELQQRQPDGVTWTAFATVTNSAARSWEVDFVQYRDGTHPVRVVVFDTYGQSAASNEVAIGAPDAPHIESVSTASGTTVTVQWTWSGQDFQSYIVQQQDAQLTWHDLAQIFAQTTMQWTGAPTLMQASRPFRVVVNAGTPSPVAVNSNEVSLVAGPPPAPVLGLITTSVLPNIHVPWTWTGALNFGRFVIQQRNGAMVWQDLATITNPATVNELGEFEWTGQMLPTGQAWPFRIVVYLTTGDSATSAMGYITQP